MAARRGGGGTESEFLNNVLTSLRSPTPCHRFLSQWLKIQLGFDSFRLLKWLCSHKYLTYGKKYFLPIVNRMWRAWSEACQTLCVFLEWLDASDTLMRIVMSHNHSTVILVIRSQIKVAHQVTILKIHNWRRVIDSNRSFESCPSCDKWRQRTHAIRVISSEHYSNWLIDSQNSAEWT